MNILNIDTCPLCGKTHFEEVMTCTDHYATGEKFTIYRCKACGFLFTQHVPDESEIGRYYESPDYISHTDTRKGLANRLYHYVRGFMLGRKASLIERICGTRNGSLLDIGTGTGYFSHFMQKRGWKVSAIEKSPQARAFAKEHFELMVEAPEALAAYGKGSFDVITLWHVMEHLQDINGTWKRLADMLKERGVLVVAVPNPVSFDAQHYREMWAAYDVPRHLGQKQLADRHSRMDVRVDLAGHSRCAAGAGRAADRPVCPAGMDAPDTDAALPRRAVLHYSRKSGRRGARRAGAVCGRRAAGRESNRPRRAGQRCFGARGSGRLRWRFGRILSGARRQARIRPRASRPRMAAGRASGTHSAAGPARSQMEITARSPVTAITGLKRTSGFYRRSGCVRTAFPRAGRASTRTETAGGTRPGSNTMTAW